MRRIELDVLIAAKQCPQQDLVLAMITEGLLHPASKLATTRFWHTTALADELPLADADEHKCYAALDWLFARHDRIEKNSRKGIWKRDRPSSMT
jgi:hypothetical protein